MRQFTNAFLSFILFISFVVSPASAQSGSLDGIYEISVKRIWQDAYWKSKNDRRYKKGRTELIQSAKIEIKNNKVRFLQLVENNASSGPAFESFRGQVSNTGTLTFTVKVNKLLGKGKHSPYTLNSTARLKSSSKPGDTVRAKQSGFDAAYKAFVSVKTLKLYNATQSNVVASSKPSTTSYAPQSAVPKNSRNELKSVIQPLLAELGYYKGAIDGIAGPHTDRAIAAFEKTISGSNDGFLSQHEISLLETNADERRKLAVDAEIVNQERSDTPEGDNGEGQMKNQSQAEKEPNLTEPTEAELLAVKKTVAEQLAAEMAEAKQIAAKKAEVERVAAETVELGSSGSLIGLQGLILPLLLFLGGVVIYRAVLPRQVKILAQNSANDPTAPISLSSQTTEKFSNQYTGSIRLGAEETKRKLAAIVAVDVVGWSRHMGLDEAGTLAQLKSIRRQIVDPVIENYGGRIFNTAGDSMLMEFPSAVDAVRCSVHVQKEMHALTTDDSLIFRVGINLGDVIVDGQDIFGDGVNVAARLEASADAGGIAISDSVHEQIAGKLPAKFHDAGQHSFKNINRQVRVWKWADESAHTAPLRVG